MSEYRHILAALELEDASRRVLAKAQSLAVRHGAKLSVVHVLDALPVRPTMLGELDAAMLPPVDISAPLAEHARRRLLSWCDKLGIPTDAVEVVVDAIRPGITDHAERIAADLLVIGRHPHHGLSALFNHTEQGVLSRAPCDVLAVALGEG